MTELHLVTFHNTSIYHQLQIEEALLRTDQRNWCLINIGSPPAIVIGISGKPEQLICSEKMKSRPVPIFKRFSGGGTVFVDQHTIFVTLICNKENSCFPQQVMEWNGNLYYDLLHPYGYRLQENDYTIKDRKFGGNAQYFTKNRWLQHSTLLWDYSTANMEYLLLPQKTPAYRKARSHSDFLCRLKDYLPNVENLTSGFINSLRKKFMMIQADHKELKDIILRPHRKSTMIVDTEVNHKNH